MADRDQKALIGAEVLPDALQFHDVKGTHFRTVHVDGIWGGPTGRGYIHAVVYTERHPIPRVTEAKVVD